MSDKTGIEWTQATWNPTVGCRRVSEGCRNCYAEPTAQRIVAMQRALGKVSPYEDVVRMDAASGAPLPLWNGHVKALADRLDQPLRWSKPRLIFVNSMSDLFHEDVPDEFIDQVFAIMAATPHTYQLLTKRPARMLRYLQRVAASQPHDEVNARVFDLANATFGGFAALPLTNLWVGVSVENQAAADERIPLLLECPAAVRWVSYEPALGPVDLGLQSATCDCCPRRSSRWVKLSHDVRGDFMWAATHAPAGLYRASSNPHGALCVQATNGEKLGIKPDEFEALPALNWIVVGGESGPGARPFDLAWARDVVRQCEEAGVPVFVKQLGAWAYVRPSADAGRFQTRLQTLGAPLHPARFTREEAVVRLLLDDRKGGDMDEWPEDLRVRQWPEGRA